MTPYQKHNLLNHQTSRYSPNGIDTLEECEDCGMRFLHSVAFGYPITLDRNYKKLIDDQRKGSE